MKSTCTCEVAAGASTYVENVAFAVKNQACWRSTFERTPTSVHTFASTATLPSKPKVGGENEEKDCFRLLILSDRLSLPDWCPGEHQYSAFCVSSCQETLPNTWNQRPTGKNARWWECLSHHWMIRRARKQVLEIGLDRRFTFLPPLAPPCTVETIGAQLDELPDKARSCSAWQLMQHRVLFYSPWPCIRNVKK